MKTAKLLIDAAVKVCGSQAEVARQLGAHPAQVTEWKTGTRPLSPEDAALLADLGNMDARQAVIDAVIERNANSRRGRLLFEILGKAQAAGVAAVLVFFYAAQPSNATAGQIRNHHPINYSTHRI